ncbi:MAG: filamentous hemagglutinin N-terminal domain-containing protein, partial [Desulfoarculaceae bacterium]|nr:filamentous hemagglutinin N-terminal domain-containing protein [Desulfoarculaceae bacterium]
MNRIYRLIWNNRTGTFVAVSENAKSTGKKSSSGATVVAGAARLALTALAIPVLMSLATNAYALPAGGVVSAGDVSITSDGGSMIITQSTPNTAINWQSFSVGQGETVQFVQPDGSSVALNRVLGSDASSILGSLSANGKVFLLNPNGILFGEGAQVSVGGLIASTLGLSDSDFMAGRYQFSGDSNGTVLNQGTITADGGYVALLGANVSNEGIISARLGTVALAAGN